jgi:hypothetical protein
MAVLYESMRHSGIVPVTAPKSVVKDTTYKGYVIPKVAYNNISIETVLKYNVHIEKFNHVKLEERSHGPFSLD